MRRSRTVPVASGSKPIVVSAGNVDFVNGIFGAHVLKDAFVNLRISDEQDAAAGSAVASFLGVLKNRPNIFVHAW